MKARSLEQIEEVVHEYGYNLLNTYIKKNKNRGVVIQDNFGFKYDIQLNDLLSGKTPVIHINSPYYLENISLWLKLNNKTFEISRENDSKIKSRFIIFFCVECSETFKSSWHDIFYSGVGCPYCSRRRVGKHNNLEYLRPDISREWSIKNGKDSPKNYTPGSHKLAWWNCSINGEHHWRSTINSRSRGSGCPICAYEQRESKVATLLKKYFIDNFHAIEEYKVVKNPKTGWYLPYDIFIPYSNIFIEVHGEQHYKYTKSFHKNKEAFSNQKYRDKVKKKYAEENGTYIEIDLRKIKGIEEALTYITIEIGEGQLP